MFLNIFKSFNYSMIFTYFEFTPVFHQ